MFTVDLGLVALAVALVFLGRSIRQAAREHGMVAADALADRVAVAVDRACAEMRYRTKAATGRLKPPKDPARPKESQSEATERFEAWLAGRPFSEAEKDALAGAWEIANGTRMASPARRDEQVAYLKAAGAPIP